MEGKTDHSVEIAGIIVKSFAGMLDETERGILDAWLAGEGRMEFYESLRGGDQGERERRLSHVVGRSRNWKALRKHMVRPRLTWARYAAAACVVLATGTFFALRERRSVSPQVQSGVTIIMADGRSVELPPDGSVELDGVHGAISRGEDNTLTVTAGELATDEYHTIVIPRRANYRLELADGSVVLLNAETRLRFPVAFADSCRRVFVEGEAYFDVAHRPEQPFIVDAGDVLIEALGTRFNVCAYPADQHIGTTLTDGSVRIVDRVGRAVTLMPDEQMMFDRATGAMQVRTVDARALSGWTENLFVFRNETVERIMGELARWYDVDVTYGNEQVKELRFTGNFDRSAPISDILAMLSGVYDVEFSLRGGTVTVNMK